VGSELGLGAFEGAQGDAAGVGLGVEGARKERTAGECGLEEGDGILDGGVGDRIVGERREREEGMVAEWGGVEGEEWGGNEEIRK